MLTSAEMDFLQTLFSEFETNPKECNPWEQKFMQSNYERFEEHQESTHVSAKQWAILKDIADKYGVGLEE